MNETEPDKSVLEDLKDVVPDENEDIFLYNDVPKTEDEIVNQEKIEVKEDDGEKFIPNLISDLGLNTKKGRFNKQRIANYSFFYFVYSQFFPSYYDPVHDDANYIKKCHKVTSIFKIPLQLEIFMIYGFLQCTNSFLQIFTFLPIRFLIANFHLVYIFLFYLNLNVFKIKQKYFMFSFLNRFNFHFKKHFSSSEICDLLKGYLLIFSSLSFYMIDSSMIYHLVRGQAIIKLYIFYNMLEVADRLCNSLGQDILESLYWAAANDSPILLTKFKHSTKSSNHFGLLIHFLLALIYLFIHAFLILLQATSLNVAFNSHNKALLTIMISNNFVELKGNVFKKFEKGNLFQMSCSDVRERFNYVIALSIVLLRNMTEFSWSVDHFIQIFPDMLFVFLAEIFIDWVKHAFITKFNDIPIEVYTEYTAFLAKDVVGDLGLHHQNTSNNTGDNTPSHTIKGTSSSKNPHPKFLNLPKNKPSNHTTPSEKGDHKIPSMATSHILSTPPSKTGGQDNSGANDMFNQPTYCSIFTDNNSDLVCKQSGFTPLPLAVVIIKTILQTCKASNFRIFTPLTCANLATIPTFITTLLTHIGLLGITNYCLSILSFINFTNLLIVLLIYANTFLVKIWISLVVWGLGYEICKKNES